MGRIETRMDRYKNKSNNVILHPVSLVAVNFQVDGNLGFLIRAAACFGAKDVHVIGSIPERSRLKDSSGSTVDLVKIFGHKNPGEFLSYIRNVGGEIVSAELCEGSENIYNFKYDLNQHTYIVVGSETTGVPTEILFNSKKVYIPMPGPGFCLNTSQTANIMLNEYCRQRSCV